MCYSFMNLQGLEELRHCLVYKTLELEATIVSAKEEITKKECELIHVNDLLTRVMKERDEAKAKCQKLMLEKLELQQHQRDTKSASENFSDKHSAPTASSDCEENSMPSTNGSSTPHSTALEAVLELAEKKALPEKGKLLKAVVEAGPLLQTLLLAGPLPQWQHPPPQLNSIEIPPVTISSPNKREFVVLSSGNECPVTKCRKVTLTPTTTTASASHDFLPHPSFS